MKLTTPTVTIADALRDATARLAAAGSATPRLDAEVLLRHVLGLDRTALFLRRPDRLPAASRAPFADLIERRLAGEPVAYITGEREFMGLPFRVRPGVLVPRPETEGLVEWALAWVESRPAATVVDAGTGSGVIALSLAAHLPATWRGRIVAVDISAAALAVARENRTRLSLETQVRLVRGNLLDWCGGPVDLLLANLPYLRPEQLAATPGLAAEPPLALLGGEDGLDLIRCLVADAPRVLAAGGALGLEIDPAQATTVRETIDTALPGGRVTVLPDLAGLARYVVAERGDGSPSAAQRGQGGT